MQYIPNSFLAEFSGCTSSYVNINYLELRRCENAIDGKFWNYWSSSILPAWAIFELTEERDINTVALMSGSATAHWAVLLRFKVHTKRIGREISIAI